MVDKSFPYIFSNSKVEWRTANNLLHREEGSTIEGVDGTLYWSFGGLLHRDNGPAIVYTSGREEYYKHGIFYPDDK